MEHEIEHPMTQSVGFYTIMQFCPDAERGECANVGVVVFPPEAEPTAELLGKGSELLQLRFPEEDVDEHRLTVSMRGLVERLRRARIRSPGDLKSFISKEAGALRLTAPRALIVEDGQKVVAELFQRLVEPKRKKAAVFGYRQFGILPSSVKTTAASVRLYLPLGAGLGVENLTFRNVASSLGEGQKSREDAPLDPFEAATLNLGRENAATPGRANVAPNQHN